MLEEASFDLRVLVFYNAKNAFDIEMINLEDGSVEEHGENDGHDHGDHDGHNH